MHTGVTLQAASDSDADRLATLRVRAMQPSLEQLGRFDPQRARARFLDGFCAAHTRHVVLGATHVGVVVVRPGAEVLLLEHLYIAPEHQGRGLGGCVLDAVFAEADALGLPIRVGALQGSASNRFYLRHGFRLVEQAEWDNYYLRPPATGVNARRTPPDPGARVR